jgi:FeS assembly SUF system protein
MFRLARLARRPEPQTAAPPAAAQDAGIEERIVAALRTVFDPEIPVNVYDLGLIYDLAVDPSGRVAIRMTLTAPACPVAGMMPGLVESAVRPVDGVSDVSVELVWDPPWTKDRMSEEARLQLGLM